MRHFSKKSRDKKTINFKFKISNFEWIINDLMFNLKKKTGLLKKLNLSFSKRGTTSELV